jgi:hypothetical protein
LIGVFRLRMESVKKARHKPVLELLGIRLHDSSGWNFFEEAGSSRSAHLSFQKNALVLPRSLRVVRWTFFTAQSLPVSPAPARGGHAFAIFGRRQSDQVRFFSG